MADVSRKGGKKGRKVGRNYRRGGVTLSVSLYRSRHNIPAGSRRENHRDGKCRLHRGVDTRR